MLSCIEYPSGVWTYPLKNEGEIEMNRNEAITALVKYALEKELIEQEEKCMGSKPDLGGYAGRFFLMGRVRKGAKEAGLTEDTGHID